VTDQGLAVASRYAGRLGRAPGPVADDLETFIALLTKWQRIQNLVSRETLSEVWERHVADSLQVLNYLRPADRLILDLGSGGGFPAVPLAIASKGSNTAFTLVEPSGRKASFLRTVARELGLAVTVLDQRAEQIDSRETPDVITARAVTALPELLALASPFFGPATRAIFHKGREYGEEVEQSRARWRFDMIVHPSDTDPRGVLLEISHLRVSSAA
jgi:16S rRNA (guanine527-N7)-methyltransferase